MVLSFQLWPLTIFKTSFLPVNKKMPWALCSPFGIGCSERKVDLSSNSYFGHFLPVTCRILKLCTLTHLNPLVHLLGSRGGSSGDVYSPWSVSFQPLRVKLVSHGPVASSRGLWNTTVVQRMVSTACSSGVSQTVYHQIVLPKRESSFWHN